MAKPFAGRSRATRCTSTSRCGATASPPSRPRAAPRTRCTGARSRACSRTCPGITLYGAPTVNSYKRFEALSFAPDARELGRRQPDRRRALARRDAGGDAHRGARRRGRRAAALGGGGRARGDRGRRSRPTRSRAPGARGEGNLYGSGDAAPRTLAEGVAAARADRPSPRSSASTPCTTTRCWPSSSGARSSTRSRDWDRSRYLRRSDGRRPAAGAAAARQPGGAAARGGVPGARGDLHPPLAPLRARRRAHRPAGLPLRGRARAALGGRGGDPRRGRAPASPASPATSGRSPTPTARGTGARQADVATPAAAYPSPLATHGTELFWTNDDGVYVLPQRDVAPERYTQLGDAARAQRAATRAR